MQQRVAGLVFSVLLGLVGCTGGSSAADAGATDVGTTTTDTGASDAGATDASATDAAVDELTVACEQVLTTNVCADACIAARDASTACAAPFAAMMASPEFGNVLSCLGTCGAERTCTFDGGAGRAYTDCVCSTACIRAASAQFQELGLAASQCTVANLPTECL